MPLTTSAIKKVRVDARRYAVNLRSKRALKVALDSFKKQPTTASLSAASRALSLAAKKKVIHQNKASRLLSRLSRKITSKK